MILADLLHDIGLSGFLIGSGFVLLLLALADLTPGAFAAGWWLNVAATLLVGGILLHAIERLVVAIEGRRAS